MGKAKVITKAIKKLAGKKDKKMKYSSTKAEKENAIEELKRSYGRNYEPTDREIREEVKLQRMMNAKDPVKAAKDLIKERRKEDKLDSSQRKRVKEIAAGEEDKSNELYGFYDRGGDVVNPLKNLVSKRPDKQRPSYSERMRRPNRKKTKSEKEMRKFLTGSVASEFALTPADRYMKGRGTPVPKKKSKVIRKGM